MVIMKNLQNLEKNLKFSGQDFLFKYFGVNDFFYRFFKLNNN